jgi:hypothetical protein
MHAALLLTTSLLTQYPTASMEFRNQTYGQSVTIWVWNYAGRGWANGGRPLVLRPNAAGRLNLYAGRYRIYVNDGTNASVTYDRVLAPNQVTRMGIGGGSQAPGKLVIDPINGNYTYPAAPSHSQMAIESINGNYTYPAERQAIGRTTPPAMEPARAPMPAPLVVPAPVPGR